MVTQFTYSLFNHLHAQTMDYWGPSKKLLGDLSFLQQLRDYDKDNIPDTLMEKVNKEYVRLPEFEPALVAKASSAAEGLCKWVRAMSAYHAIAKVSECQKEILTQICNVYFSLVVSPLLQLRQFSG